MSRPDSPGADRQSRWVEDRPLRPERQVPRSRLAGIVCGQDHVLAWLDGVIEHGYSGGPVVEREGTVIGVSVRKITQPAARLFIAVGTKEMAALTSKIAMTPAATPIRIADGEDGEAVRPAIVHVFCWREHPTPLGEN